MPAIDINAWMSELLVQLNHNRQRQLVVLRGPQSWCDAAVGSLELLDTTRLVVSNRSLSSEPVEFSKADACLGREAMLVVLDLFTGFNPDVLCIAAGLVRAGGVLVLLSPGDGWQAQDDRYASWQDESHSLQARFSDYFFTELELQADIGLLLTPESSSAPVVKLPELKLAVFEQGLTRQQAECMRRIEQWLAAAQDGVVLLRAERGRGKSSCLGMLVTRIQDNCRVLVCADSRRAAATLLHWAPQADFIAPDRLLLENPAADLIVIDEAAMIPGHLLQQISRQYPRLLMATTSGGYEGTGQGFMLRFIADFESRKLLQLELTDPVRWCSGDRLESWLNQVLLIDSVTGFEDTLIDPSNLRLELVEDAGVPEFFDSLRQVYRLLNSAHYRTRPSDLRMLMENPDLSLLIARCGEQVVGAALLNREGGFNKALSELVFLGQRRPKGHLLAQMLTAQAGIGHFAGYRGLRVQRIAVSEPWRRRGLGSRMLERTLEYARSSGLEYVGASFALDPQNASFWQKAGFSLAHVSFAQGKSSGNHSIAVLAALSSEVEADQRQLCQRIKRQLPTWLTQFLQVLDAEQVTALLRCSDFNARVSELEIRELEAFALGNKGFELCFFSLQKFCMQRVAQSDTCPDKLVIEKAIQNRPWRQLEREQPGEGRRQLQKRLRGLVEAELKAC